jgi:hypothetical protein
VQPGGLRMLEEKLLKLSIHLMQLLKILRFISLNVFFFLHMAKEVTFLTFPIT